MDDEELYAGHDPLSFNKWFRLQHEHIPETPFKFYFVKLKSNSPEAIEFFMDPLSAMKNGFQSLDPLEGIKDDTRITTTIVGHERTLKLRVILAVASVDEQNNSVAILSNKEMPPS
jgi:hypothetical protein